MKGDTAAHGKYPSKEITITPNGKKLIGDPNKNVLKSKN